MQCSMRSTRLSHVMYKSDNIKLNAALQFVVYRVYSVRPICLKSHRLRGARRARILINHQSSQQQHTQSINMDGYIICMICHGRTEKVAILRIPITFWLQSEDNSHKTGLHPG